MARSTARTWVAGPLPMLLSLAACGHGEAASKPDAPPPRAAAPAPRSQEASAPPAEHIEDYMLDHFVIVTFSRDAVINGDVDALREPLRVFADYRYAQVVPGGWLPWMAQLQEAARLTSEATTLEAAATGVATMARACGSCHEANAAGPDFGSSGRESETPGSDTLDARMRRHMWAADRMWEGLTGASDQAWQDGASALAHTPAAAPRTDPPLPPEFVAALLDTRALAADALDATTLEQRADVYASYLGECASCHSYGVELAF